MLDVAAGCSALFQILLVIFFGRPKRLCGNHLGDDGLRIFMFCGQARDGRSRGLLLLRRMIKNHRAVLRSKVRALAIQLRRIMFVEECVEEVLITHLGRIERDL